MSELGSLMGVVEGAFCGARSGQSSPASKGLLERLPRARFRVKLGPVHDALDRGLSDHRINLGLAFDDVTKGWITFRAAPCLALCRRSLVQ